MSLSRRFLLRNFYVLYRLDQWVGRRFTPAGKLVITALCVAGLFGIDVHQTLAYQVFTLAAALLAFGFLSIPFFRGRFSAARELPRSVTAGEPFRYVVRLTNHTSRPQRGLCVRECLRAEALSSEAFACTEETPAERRRNVFDRFVGYPRWAWLMRRQRGADAPLQSVPEIPPGGTVRVQMSLTALRRGYVRLLGMSVQRTDPLGLVNAFAPVGAAASLLALPRRYSLPRLHLPGRPELQSSGADHARARGLTEEFVALREYRPGDPLRHLHWPSWARLGQPVVKEFQGEQHHRHAVLLDTRMRYRVSERFEEAVSVAASLVCADATQARLMDLVLAGTQILRFTAGPGAAPVERLLEVLACVEASGHEAFGERREIIAAHLSAAGAAVLVLLDWDAPRRNLVEHLRRAGISLLVLVVMDTPASLQAGPMRDQPERLRSLQSGRIAEGLASLSERPPEASPAGAGGSR
ncbi:MAG: DUF58 domain-containing protein [Gammaproteobacteria bacterium]|nr:DUF58 domain-containing protein [Gammaproteobacteria bacterium]NIR82686.1 DUF58 domain-containing protein [Gammaproteobacteria bacterium]NIR89393.1 DUF58 domain-containing protein [Gammaproteobacteria bacterium]NIU03834.1 DUF58 domain-containing protein [Gammaproteobacteria bacterium]NIV51168.1 DUF58 domain-containing protein [Gammaproteobacteria bacterium]